jgi:putative redox protein
MSTTLTGTVELVEGMTFRANTDSGHKIVLDAAPEHGGADRGPRPMELLVVGLAGCTAMDVIGILRKMRQDVTGYQVRVWAERAEEHPKVLTSIIIEHVLRGRAVNPEAVRKAVELSATRYCSVGAMLKQAAPIEERYRIVDESTGGQIVRTLALPAT